MKERGITLIALIITIIILVILAAVSIASVYNRGIVNYAVNGTQEYGKAAKEEDRIMQETEGFIEGTLSRIKYGTSVEVGQKAKGGSKTYTSGSYTAIIPEGWVVSGKTTNNDETTIETGLVIYYINDLTEEQIAAIDWTDTTTTENLRKTYDQLVWIPMPRANINKMFMCQSEDGTNSCRITLDNSGEAYCTTHNSNLMAGRLYSTNNSNAFNANQTAQTYNANSGYREPAVVTGNSTGDGTNYDNKSYCLDQLIAILGTGADSNEKYDSAANFKVTLQNEYNRIVKSVYENEGFWVGRYETGGMQNEDVVPEIKIVAGLRHGYGGIYPAISYVTWYRMYAQQKKYAEGKGMLGGMIQGAAFDQMLLFVDADPGYDITTPGQVGHVEELVGDEPYETGNTSYPSESTVPYNDLVNNIYDLEGNVIEMTTEAGNTNYRVHRGGNTDYKFSASGRYCINYPAGLYGNTGTRIALYIK